MSLSNHDTADLSNYFGGGSVESAARRSTFGAALDRQMGRYYDSTGARIPAVERRSWLYMQCREQQSSEACYEPNHSSSMISAVVSRRLRGLSDLEAAVLETYYGDIGQHWRLLWDGRRRIGCLFHLTELGRAIVTQERVEGRELGHPHRVIEELWRAEDGTPSKERERELRMMEHAAHRLLADAEEAFRRTR